MTPEFTMFLVAVGLLAAYAIGFCRGWRSRNGEVERMREALMHVDELNAKGLVERKDLKELLQAATEERDALLTATQRAAAALAEGLEVFTGPRA